MRATWTDDVRQASRRVRRRVLEHTLKHNGGYMSQACSSAEILATLYLKVMNLAPLDKPLRPRPFPGVPSRDNRLYATGAEFNGRAASAPGPVLPFPGPLRAGAVRLLIEAGRMDPSGLDDFNRDGSSVEMIGAEHSPGMEVTAGSLGQCLSQAAGIALARRINGDQGKTWVFMSDGEFQIGQTWEALQAASFHQLDRLAVYVDVNGQQCDGLVAKVMNLEPLHARLESFRMARGCGWTATTPRHSLLPRPRQRTGGPWRCCATPIPASVCPCCATRPQAALPALQDPRRARGLSPRPGGSM
jgi:transketolase